MLSIPGIAVAVIGLENIAEIEKAASVVARANPLTRGEPRSRPDRPRSRRYAGVENRLWHPAGMTGADNHVRPQLLTIIRLG